MTRAERLAHSRILISRHALQRFRERVPGMSEATWLDLTAAVQASRLCEPDEMPPLLPHGWRLPENRVLAVGANVDVVFVLANIEPLVFEAVTVLIPEVGHDEPVVLPVRAEPEYRVGAVAKLLGMSPKRVDQICNSGELPFYMLKIPGPGNVRVRRIKRSAVEAWAAVNGVRIRDVKAEVA